VTLAEAYGVTSWRVVAILLALFATVIASGFFLGRTRWSGARGLAWAIAVAALLLTERICDREPPGFRMLALCGALLYAMKGVVAVEARRAGSEPLGIGRWLAFAVGWFGMRPQAFARRAPGKPSRTLARRGSILLLAGAGLVALARLPDSRLITTLLLLPGLSLMGHFGLFNLLAAFWRRQGFDVGPLFRAPIAARSLGEFWSRRWNLAFAQMTALAVARPIERRLGRGGALLASFAFSGVLHEIAISWPVRAGFGGPSLYFALHGAATLAEEALLRRNLWPRGLAGRACTLVLLLLPVPLLFHGPFLRGTMWPLAR
jgi:alginate O-acetyltransferase complex protein AlgI